MTTVFWSAGTVMMMDAAGLEVAGAEAIDDELAGDLTWNTKAIVYGMPVACETALTTTTSVVPARFSGGSAVRVWSRLPDNVTKVPLAD